MFDKLIQAIHNNNIDVVNEYVRDHTDILSQTDSDKLSPLHHACMIGNSEITRILLGDAALVPNCQTVNGTTPLHFAARNGQSECVKLLLQFRATVNICDSRKWSPLHYACFDGHFEVAKMLVENKANLNMTTDEGYTPLHLCCYKGYIKIAELLISHGANISLTDRQGNTPLCFLPIESENSAICCETSENVNEKSQKKRKGEKLTHQPPPPKRVKEEEEEKEEEKKEVKREDENNGVSERDVKSESIESDPNRGEFFSLIMSSCCPPDVQDKMNSTNKILSNKFKWYLNNVNRDICKDIINKMRKKKELYPATFEKPVTEEIAPKYFDFIERPMDFETLSDYLAKQKIITLKEFVICGRQIWQNCFTYNVRTPLFDLGRNFALYFENSIAKAAWGQATEININDVMYSWNDFLGKFTNDTLVEIANKSGLGDEEELDITKNFDKIRKGFFLVNTRDLKEQ